MHHTWVTKRLDGCLPRGSALTPEGPPLTFGKELIFLDTLTHTQTLTNTHDQHELDLWFQAGLVLKYVEEENYLLGLGFLCQATLSCFSIS